MVVVVVVDDDEPPQPQMKRSTARTAGTAKIRDRRKLANSIRPNAPSASMPPITEAGGRSSNKGKLLEVLGAVVATVTVTDAGELPLKLTELGMLQVGASLGDGVIAQVKFTVPLKAPVGVRVRLNVAVFPADTVAELDPPDAMPQVKPGAAVPVPVRLTIWGELIALSVIRTVAFRVPAACAVNVTAIVQVVPEARLAPQLLVSA